MKTLTTLLALISFSAFAQMELDKPATCSAICTISGNESTARQLVLGKGVNLEMALLDLQTSCDANKTCDEETAEISTAIGKTGTISFDEKLACNVSSQSRDFKEVSCMASTQQPVIKCNGSTYHVSQSSYQVLSNAFHLSQQENIAPVIINGEAYVKIKITGSLTKEIENTLDIQSAAVYR